MIGSHVKTTWTLRRPKRRGGYTYIELIAAIGSASVLMVALASTILIANQAFVGNGATHDQSEAAQIQGVLMADLQHALSFSELTATAATFTVPDRDGDGAPDTIRYSWSATAGDPLLYEYNGAAAEQMAVDVQTFNLTWLTRFIEAPVPPPSEDASNILFAVGDPASLTTKDINRKELIESWGYTVTLIDDSDSAANFETAIADAVAVYIGTSTSASALASKVESSTVGIVNENALMLDNFGFSSGVQFISSSTVRTSDVAHYITSDYTAGSTVTILTSSLSLPIPSSILAPGLGGLTGVFGDGKSAKPALVTLDTSAERYDSTLSAGRRVHLPYTPAEVGDMATDGQTLMRRSIEWAAGAGDDSPGESIFGYDTIFAGTRGNVRRKQFATQVILSEPGTATSITAYVGGAEKPLRYAIYADEAGEPGALLAQTENEDTEMDMQWTTIALPNTVLAAGAYWLALSFDHRDQQYAFEVGGHTRQNNNRATNGGFTAPWGSSTDSINGKISIYATYTPLSMELPPFDPPIDPLPPQL